MNTSSTETVHHIMEIAVTLADRITTNYQNFREKHPDGLLPGIFVDSLIDALDIQERFAEWCHQRATEAGAFNPQIAAVSIPEGNTNYNELKANLENVRGAMVVLR